MTINTSPGHSFYFPLAHYSNMDIYHHTQTEKINKSTYFNRGSWYYQPKQRTMNGKSFKITINLLLVSSPPKRVPFNEPCINKPTHLHPQKLTWNLQNTTKRKRRNIYIRTQTTIFFGSFKMLVLKGGCTSIYTQNNVCFCEKKSNTNLPDLLWRQAGQITVLNEATGFRAVVILYEDGFVWKAETVLVGKGGNAEGGKLRNIEYMQNIQFYNSTYKYIYIYTHFVWYDSNFVYTK